MTWLISFLRSLSICFLEGNYYQSIIIIISFITNWLGITTASFLVTKSTTDQLCEWRHGRQNSNRSFPHPGWITIFFYFSFFLSLFLYIFLLISMSLSLSISFSLYLSPPIQFFIVILLHPLKSASSQ